MSLTSTWEFRCLRCSAYAIGSLDYVERFRDAHVAHNPDHTSQLWSAPKAIDRKAWRDAYLTALIALESETSVKSPYGREWISTDGAADRMAEYLGIPLAEPEPPEVELSKLVASWEHPMSFGVMYSFSPAEYDRARELARMILAGRGGAE